MSDAFHNIEAAVATAVWGTPLAALPRHRRLLVKWLRIVHMLLRELAAGSLTTRAASLVFTTLLSLVPLLAVSFSLLKAFGVHNRLEQVLLRLLEPLGERGAEIATRIVGFVEQVKVGVLGGVGLVVLLVTVVSLVQKVEQALNSTWRVRRTRSIGLRFSGYLSVILVGPLLVFSSIALIGTLAGTEVARTIAAMEPFGTLLTIFSRLLPYALTIAAFTFVYVLIPNTRVRLASALVGGTVAGVLWATAGWAFAVFVVDSPQASYTAIYQSFAVIFFFMLWVYVAWLILLVGGTVAFYHQRPQYLGVMQGELKASNRLRERIAIAIMLRVGACHLEGERPPDVFALAESLGLPFEQADEALEALRAEGLVALVEEPAGGYLPARDVGSIRLADVLTAARRAHLGRDRVPEHLPEEVRAEVLVQELEDAAARALGERTLRTLLVAGARAGQPGPEGAARDPVATERAR